jgi:2-keto-3-deoxy-6-phosphogluconate aldolase
MSRLFETYRAVHEQAFVPLFVHDDRDSHLLVEACAEAGCRVIEYTQRRQDAPTMIPWIRRRFPELHILAGSTLEDDAIVHQARRRHPQLRTLAELSDMGVDGFVSLVGWKPDNIRKHAATHLVIPAAMTVNEAYQQFAAGAHFIKVFGPGLDLVRWCRNPAAFEFCPLFITGGMTPDRISEAVGAGVMVVGSGFDLLLRDTTSPGSAADIGRVVRHYIDVTRAAQCKAWPALAAAAGQDCRTWLDALPHNHHFGGLESVR